MEKVLGPVIAIAVFFLWVGGLIWMIKRFRKTWDAVKSGRVNLQPGERSAAPPARAVHEPPKTNAMGLVTETLEESLVKHRKKVEQELAQLLKSQTQRK